MRIGYREGVYYYYLSHSNRVRSVHDLDHCHYCGYNMNSAYVYIIKKLKKLGLLDRNYKLRCCVCNILLEKVGKIYCSCGQRLAITATDDWFDPDPDSKRTSLGQIISQIRCRCSHCQSGRKILWKGVL